MGYYYAEPGMTVAEIARRWMAGEKMYDASMPYAMDLFDLWKYRDYTWTRETSRMGWGLPYYLDDKQKELPGPEKWDIMSGHMQKHGWDNRQPVHLYVGKDGKAKIGEGNHRLAVWKMLGRREVPVQVFFNEKVRQTHPDFSRPPQKIETFRHFLMLFRG
jgi:hypothetical protein